MAFKIKEIKRYIPELSPEKIRKNVGRWWKIYVNPPKESRTFVKPQELPEIGKRLDVIKTKGQPKQVIFDPKAKLAYISCMSGKALQVFSLNNNKLKLTNEIDFNDQCVELAMTEDYVYVTTTNFEKFPFEPRNKLSTFDKKNLNLISQVDTGGNWSKVIAIRPQKDEVLISNWESQNISVIDISDPRTPTLKQLLKWGKAPRGIEFVPDGNRAVVTGFYSGNLGILERDKNGKWNAVYTSERFDYPNYSGNMRHVLIDHDGDTAVVSNMGRNLIHFWSISQKKFLDSVVVGKYPNTICWITDELIAVSCRKSRSIYILNKINHKLIGRSEETSEEPTGLCKVNDHQLLVTGFKKGNLEIHEIFY
jgi:hypothetical protein